MKIRKTKLVESKLNEAEDDDLELNDINPQEDPNGKIADAIQNEVEAATDGEVKLSDEQAAQAAEDTKEAAKELGTDKVEVVSEMTVNRLTKALDRSLAIARENLRRGETENANLLVEGLPGSGKTSIIKAWARANQIVLVPVNCTDPKLEVAVNGMWLRDANNPDQIKQIRSNMLGKLVNENTEYAGRCVLFVDEYNRQPNMAFRRVFLSLFADKENGDGTIKLDKNLLFSVVAINPFGPDYNDKGVSPLIGPEKSRFMSKVRGYDSNTEDSLDFYQKRINNKLAALGVAVPGSKQAKLIGKSGPFKDISDPQVQKDINSEIKINHLAEYILSNLDFTFDGRDPETQNELFDEDKTPLDSRMLASLIIGSRGDVDAFKDLVQSADLLDGTEKMLLDCLNGYVIDIAAERKKYGLDGTGASEASGDEGEGEGEGSEGADGAEGSAGAEDDDDLFVSQGNSGGKQSIMPNETEQRINDVFDNLKF